MKCPCKVILTEYGLFWTCGRSSSYSPDSSHVCFICYLITKEGLGSWVGRQTGVHGSITVRGLPGHVGYPPLASYPGLPSQLFLQPWKKAWVRPGSKHHVTLAIAFVTTRVHGFICTRDVFHVAHSGTLAALCCFQALPTLFSTAAKKAVTEGLSTRLLPLSLAGKC